MIGIELIFGLAVSFAIFILSVIYYLKYNGDKRLKGLVRNLFFLGIPQIVISAFSFMWFFGFLEYASADFLLIYSIITFVQGIFLFMIIYIIVERNKNLFYFLSFYIATFILSLIIHASFMEYFVEAYFLFILLISIGLFSRNDDYRDIGMYGIAYSGISLLMQILVLAGVVNLYLFSIFYGAFLFAFITLSMNHLKNKPLPLVEDIKKNRSYIFHFLRSFVFVVALINFVFIGTVVIHEFGHLIISYFYQCASRQIVFSGGFPDTQILCTNLSSTLYVTLGGILIPVILGIILFLIGGKFLREIGILMVGFNMIIASKDYLGIGLSSNISFFLVIAGIIIAIIGIISLAKSKSEDYIYSLGHFF